MGLDAEADAGYHFATSDKARSLLEAALKLPPAERALLAEQIWRSTGPGRSLDDPDYPRELERRAVETIAGRTPGRTWAEIKAALATEAPKR